MPRGVKEVLNMKPRLKGYGSYNVIGKTVEEIRKSKGIKQGRFIAMLQSRGLDINPSSYSKLEGQIRNASDIEVYHIAAALGVPMEKLFAGINE